MKHTAPANLIGIDGATRQLDLEWSWTAHDPFAVTMTFLFNGTRESRWTISREVVAAALADYGSQGMGDVTFTRMMPNSLVLNLFLPGLVEPCVIVTTDTAAAALLAESFALVPAGRESLDVDGALARIFAGDAA